MSQGPGISLRPATIDDGPLLLHWRNDETTVRFSQTGRRVTEDEHVTWIARRLALARPLLWIAVEGEIPVGQVRVDLDADAFPVAGEVSIAVDPAHRGRGAGNTMLVLLQDMVVDLGIDCLDAWIHVDNIASLRAFSRRHLTEQERRDAFVRLRWCRRERAAPVRRTSV